MYAVIKAGGKQHKVKTGDVLEVELVHGGHEETVTFAPLLVVDDEGGAHFGKDLAKAVVKAKLVGEQKGDKVKVFKYRPKSGYQSTRGHRQRYTLIEIEDIALAASKPAARKKAEKPEETEKPEKPEATAEKPAPRRTGSKTGSKAATKSAEDAE